MRFEYKGITVDFQPYLQTFEVIEVDNVNHILKCTCDGKPKELSFEFFNLMIENKQLKLV